ncbi:MAG: glutathione S-transferase family protein [Alphaproteobacteria bacterium]|nr:MAG: glutathione S-transferase family protein [Alphaproteobacteria bacterium]
MSDETTVRANAPSSSRTPPAGASDNGQARDPSERETPGREERRLGTLLYGTFDPGSRHVRILLAEKRIDHRPVLEKAWERRPEFLRHSPDGSLPVLIEKGHPAIGSAVAIGEYLEERFPEPAFLPASAADRAEVRRLVQWFLVKCTHEVTRLVVSEKFLKRFLKLGEPDSRSIRAAHRNLKTHLAYIAHLVERRHYLAGRHVSLADVAAAANLSVLDYFGDIDWSAHPLVKDWYMRMKSRRGVRSVLAERVAGLQPPRHYDRPDF